MNKPQYYVSRKMILRDIVIFFSGLVASDCYVELNQGTINGTTDNEVEVYRGVPYAKPPLGDLR